MLAPLPREQSVPLTTPSGLNGRANQSGQILAHHILEHIRIRRTQDECPVRLKHDIDGDRVPAALQGG